MATVDAYFPFIEETTSTRTEFYKMLGNQTLAQRDIFVHCLTTSGVDWIDEQIMFQS
jgi:hypothetical protein